jgi:transposase-like protein
MTIIPIGKIHLQVNLHQTEEAYYFNLYAALKAKISEIVSQCLGVILEEEVDNCLWRERYQRRGKARLRDSDRMVCLRCGSRKTSDFRRNGHYRRGLDTLWGHIEFEMPQVECICGGNVRVTYRTIESRQRVWRDVEAHFRSEYGYGMSLREIKDKLDIELGGSLGLRTINKGVHRVNEVLPVWEYQPVIAAPPVIRVDGLWLTLMIPTGVHKKDTLGRVRAVKTGKRIPILVAQGVWPASGRQEVMGWVIAQGEDRDSWGDLFYFLRQKGVKLERVKLVIGDGSPGLEAFLQQHYPDVPFQRCIFHKLKNLWRDLTELPGMEREQVRQYKRAFIEAARQIWQAADEWEAWQRMKTFCEKWQAEQPKTIATLQRDFDLTVTFFRVKQDAAQRGEVWPMELLRTISHLERDNRRVRKRLRNAVLFHSQAGLSATLLLNYSMASAFRNSPLPGLWPQQIERQIALASNFLS